MGLGFFFDEAAGAWEEGLPLGSGRLGAMCLSGPCSELIHLNEDTLWAGGPRDLVNYEGRRHLEKLRALLREGRFHEATVYAENRLAGYEPDAYQPLGLLKLELEETDNGAGVLPFRRSLDLDDGLLRVECGQGYQMTRRSAFASAADGLVALRWEAGAGRLPRLRASFSCPHPFQLSPEGGQALLVRGRLPSRVLENYRGDHPCPVFYEKGRSVEFTCLIQILAEGGSCLADGEGQAAVLVVEGARAVTVLIAMASNFRSWDVWPEPGDPAPLGLCRDALEKGRTLGWEGLLKRHLEDHRGIMGRMGLRLGPADAAVALMPIKARKEAYRLGAADPGLEALMLAYSRYLLAASSRKGSQPANLQGIWNPHVQPPWFCEYTLNVNAGMNYWMAESCALGDCHEALADLACGLARAGRRTASVNYGCRGWVAHHNSDIWRMSWPTSGDASWFLWPMGGAILVRHLWERWLYGRDRDYLSRKAWPVIRGAALFIIDWLIDEGGGLLGTNPSTSPENKFLDDEGRACAVAISSAMDISLAREVLSIAGQAAAELGPQAEEGEGAGVAAAASAALARLRPLPQGEDGSILEWGRPFKEAEPGHRHFSPLYGLYPGSELPTEAVSAEICERFLDRRIEAGSGSTGWSASWAACLYARLGRAEKAYAMLRRAIGRFTLPSLLGNHPPFQIDANFGIGAAIMEMLFRDKKGFVVLLPALPSAWPEGELYGACLKGGFSLDMSWKNGILSGAKIAAHHEGSLELECAGARASLRLHAGQSVELGPNLALV